ncbi:MAG TPA: hypothetical protein VGE14_07320 [Marmoricola sp.]
MRQRRRPVVPQLLADQIDEAVASVDDAQALLALVVADRAPLRERRQAHARVTHAFDEADALLRRATTLTKQQSYREWSVWRHRLSSLDTARQIHLLAARDESGVLPTGSVRAIDTGMSGPAIGDLQHGESRPPGTRPTYGMDLEPIFLATAGVDPTTADPHEAPIIERSRGALVTDTPSAARTPAPRQAA